MIFSLNQFSNLYLTWICSNDWLHISIELSCGFLLSTRKDNRNNAKCRSAVQVCMQAKTLITLHFKRNWCLLMSGIQSGFIIAFCIFHVTLFPPGSSDRMTGCSWWQDLYFLSSRFYQTLKTGCLWEAAWHWVNYKCYLMVIILRN